MLTLLGSLVAVAPIGTNLGRLHLRWLLASGRLLEARGAVIPGLAACGLSDRAVRRAWATLGQGDWRSGALLTRWRSMSPASGARACVPARRPTITAWPVRRCPRSRAAPSRAAAVP